MHLGPWKLLIPVTEKNSLVTRHERIRIGCAVSLQFRDHCLSVASCSGVEVLRRSLVSIDKSPSSRAVRSLKLGQCWENEFQSVSQRLWITKALFKMQKWKKSGLVLCLQKSPSSYQHPPLRRIPSLPHFTEHPSKNVLEVP